MRGVLSMYEARGNRTDSGTRGANEALSTEVQLGAPPDFAELVFCVGMLVAAIGAWR